MNYKPNPLLYGTEKDFLSTFKLVLTMRSVVDHAVLSRAVAKAMERYPYFCVFPERKGNSLFLSPNPRPVPVFEDGRCAVLGSEEASGHLLTFGCEGRRIILNASHYIADGMGIEPVWKTVLYLYISELYGAQDLQAEKIAMPTDPVSEKEYAYPFPSEAQEVDALYLPKPAPTEVYEADPEAFDAQGSYAYHLHIPQKAMMQKANPSDGSPVSFLSVMLYRAMCACDPTARKPIVAHVQHQYRAPLRAPESRHSMVCYIPVTFAPKMKDRPVLQQNTVVRGQVLLGGEAAADISAVNHLIAAFPSGEDADYQQKKQAMQDFARKSVQSKTFGISYVGKTDWCGLDRFVEDIHAYIGEKEKQNLLLIEVMTVGEDFTLNFMQGGRGDRYLNAFIEQLRLMDIPVQIIGEERYSLCDAKIPD